MIRSFTLLSFIFHFSNNLAIEEYWIKSRDVPSYMYKAYEKVSEKIFPRDLSIVLSLSKFSGTLFYSIDMNKNQFIVSLEESVRPSLTIKSTRLAKTESVWISNLCGCELCNNKILDLKFEMTEKKMFIRCNNGAKNEINLLKTSKLIRGFPNPFQDFNVGDTGINESHLWIVNIEGFNGVYPNSDQLAGCIINVSYGGIPMIFTNITHNVMRVCPKTCIGEICNGGQCIETYSVIPLCNCTTTLLNGDYCNDTAKVTNVVSESTYRFDVIKLSWKNSSNQIFELRNENTNLSIVAKCDRLIVKYQSRKEKDTKSENIMLETYESTSESVLIAYFNDSEIDVKLLHNGSWYHTQVLVHPNIEKETFMYLTLTSGDGIIDLAYKHSRKEDKWKTVKLFKKIVVNQILEAYHCCPNSISKQPDPNSLPGYAECLSYKTTVGVLAVLLAISIIILIVVICNIKNFSRNNNLNPASGESEPMNS